MKQKVGNLTDFVESTDGEGIDLEIEFAVTEAGEILLFHNRRFVQEIMWFEFDVSTNCIVFTFANGDGRDVGLPIRDQVAKHLRDANRICPVFFDEATKMTDIRPLVPLIVSHAE